MKLPQFLLDMIAAVPPHGSGVHVWMFKVARQLHAHRSPADIVALLVAATDGCGRHVPQREIEAAVTDAHAAAWTPDGKAQPVSKPAPKWPEVNAAMQAAAIAGSRVQTVYDLQESSQTQCRPGEPLDADWIIDELFPGNPLLCIGLNMATFTTAPRESFRGKLADQSLIVPSPMTAIFGKTKDGKESQHTLSNTGPRRYLITEFDSGTKDQQAVLLCHLSSFAPLSMVVSSGGKSLHGWFNCQGIDEATTRSFFRYAVKLGADPATWTRSQFVRIPQGYRADKRARQEVVYFNQENGGHEQ